MPGTRASTSAPIFLATVVEYWELQLGKAGIPCGHLIRWSELRHHRQVVDNQYIKDVESPDWGRVFTGGPPYHLAGTPERWFRTPGIGEHNEAVRDELDRLRDRGARP